MDAVTQPNLGTADVTVDVASKSMLAGNQFIRLDFVLPSITFLNLSSRKGFFLFYSQGDLIQYLLFINLNQGANGAVPEWNFTTSYPQLALTSVTALPAVEQVMTLATVSSEYQSVTYPQGLTYQGVVSLTGPYAALVAIGSLLTGQQRLVLSGLILNNAGTISTTLLSNPITQPINLLVLTASDLKLQVVINSKRVTPSNAIVYQCSFGVQMRTSFGSLNLTAGALLDAISGRNFLQLSLLPADDTIVPLSQIISLVGGHDWTPYFTGATQPFLTFFNQFGFLSWSASVDMTNLSSVAVYNTLLRAGTRPGSPYVIVPDYLILNYFESHYMVFDPFNTRQSNLAIFAQLFMPSSNLLFDVEVNVGPTDLFISGVLTTAITGNLSDWTQSLITSFGSTYTLSPAVRNFLDVGFSLSSVGIELQRQSANQTRFGLLIQGQVELTGTMVDFSVSLGFTWTTTWSVVLSVEAEVGSSIYHGQLTNSANTTGTGGRNWLAELSWQDVNNPIGFDAIADTLGFEIPSIPTDLDLGLQAVSFSFDSGTNQCQLSATSSNWGAALLLAYQKAGNWVFVFNYAISKATQVNAQSLINLSNLPLISTVLASNATLGIDLNVLVTSADLLPEDVTALNAHITNSALYLPAAGCKAGMGFSVMLNFGGYIIPMSVGVVGEDAAAQVTTPSSSIVGQPPASTNPATPVQPLPAPVDDGTLWVNVQKTFGPVFFEKVGVAYADQKLWFALSATLKMGNFTANILGLRAGTPMDTFAPTFDIDGLGLDIRTAGFELGGALLNMRPAQGFQFAGVAVARAMGLSLALAGSYGQVTVSGRSVTTMFLFGQLNGLALGQPYLMITGLSGGAGYNSSLRLPTASTVNQFPFVANLAQTTPSSQTPMQMIQTLMSGSNPWIRTSAGQFWVAAGVSLSSFGVVKLNALAIASFGNSLELGLIGQATARFPSTGPTAFANIVLNMGATYREAEGVLSIFAVLGSASYILDPSVKLTGGFAFNSWFSGPHAGDYAITLGGYHPRYSVPLWYPRVDRLGISWSLGSTVSITGQAYLAMTPAAMMLGGLINLNYSSGSKRAWFNANFDALIQYAPFAFDLNIGITVGASYTAEVWGLSKTFTAELGANLRLWGPPVGGRVVVDWTVVTIEINFGASSSNSRANQAATWAEFQPLLPAPGKYCAVAAQSGVTGNYVPPTSSGLTQGTLVDGNSLVITTISSIPLSAAKIKQSSTITTKGTGSLQSIRPMRQTNQASEQTVVLTHLENGAYVEKDLSTWTITSIVRSVPKSLWGTYSSTNALPGPNDQLLTGQLVGLQMSPPAPTRGHAIGPVSTDNLYFAARSFSWRMPVLAGQTRKGIPLNANPEAVSTIADDIGTSDAVQARRTAVSTLKLLGFNLDYDSSNATDLQSDVTDYFDGIPMIAS
ncbi:MAG: DUF6603 domain-containing protein [Bacteroidia bacterium]